MDIREIREHAVDPAAPRIIAPASGDPEPFGSSALVTEDTFAVITIAELAFFTGWANIISALR